MLKAKSRLHQVEEPAASSWTAPATHQPLAGTRTGRTSPVARAAVGQPKTPHQVSRWKSYLRHSPLLIPGLASYGLLWYLINHFYPHQLDDLPVTGSFLTILAPFFIGTFFLTSYLMLNTRLAFYLSVALTIAAFLRLQQVLF